jgi:hypothetical protein
MITFSHWHGVNFSVRRFLVALYLRFNIRENISDQMCSLTGTAAFSVYGSR